MFTRGTPGILATPLHIAGFNNLQYFIYLFFFFTHNEHLNTRHFLTLNAFYMHLRHASS